MSYNCLDRHVENGYGDHTAYVAESAYTGNKVKVTFEQMTHKVSKFARVLVNAGVKKGDTVIIYMPMILETAVAIQACNRIGAIHSVVFGGFAASELANRIKDASPAVIVTCTTGIEPKGEIPYVPVIDKACEIAGQPDLQRIIYHRKDTHHKETNLNPKIYLDFEEEMDKVTRGHDAVPVDATHPLFILYTSGTTGSPKGIYRSHGGTTVAYNHKMKYIYDINRGDMMFSPSDFGWIVGHSFIQYAN